MLKYALSIVLILLFGTCGDRGTSPSKPGHIALEVRYPQKAAKAAKIQRVSRMVVNVLQGETVVVSKDLSYEGGVWRVELTVAAGFYSVVVDAYKDTRLTWQGSTSVQVESGKSSQAAIEMALANQAPTLSKINNRTVAVGGAMTIMLAGSDDDGDKVTYLVKDNPPGSSLEGETFMWKPSLYQKGTYEVTFIVEDEYGGQGAETITITVTGAIARRLTTHRRGDSQPAWSPDGKFIAFKSTRDDSDGDIFLMTSDGDNLLNLTKNDVGDSQPAWSPDGKFIAFVRSGDIFLMTPAGSNLQNLTNSGVGESQPAWSPDGKFIAFVRNNDIFLMTPAGSNLQNLTNSGVGESQPAWSPDGKFIAFVRNGRNRDIFLMEANGSNLQNLTSIRVGEPQPAWSPDGKFIAFVSNRNIFLMEANGSNLLNLTTNSSIVSDSQPAWSPDGKFIAFVRNNDIYLLEIAP